MNKDLEIIKQHAYVLGGDEPGTIGQQSGGIIIAAAERMAEEIDRVQKELKIYKDRCFELSGGVNRNAQRCLEAREEIDHLKAELEKQKDRADEQGRNACELFDEVKRLQAELAKIVRCGECKNFVEGGDGWYCGLIASGLKRKAKDYCSNGKRRGD